MFSHFRQPLPSLTVPQRRFVVVATLLVAITRVLALSKTLWDWDEALFAMGVSEYDVVAHHPHPPGFPLYILVAKCARIFFHSDFRALQAVTLAGALTLFPLLFRLGRELRLSFATAASGAMLYVFFPNVWFYGGTAFSDISSTALALAAVVLLLRGCRSRHAYMAGAIVLGIATGFRTQSLVIGCAPALFATICRLRDPQGGSLRQRITDFLLASSLGAAITVLSYAAAAALSTNPPFGYLQSWANLRVYLRHVDSFLAPDRPPLHSLVTEFLVRPMRAGRVSVVVSALALVAAAALFVRRRPGVWLLILTFLPFALFAWLMLDYRSIARYSVTYVVLHAMLAAEGAGVLTSFLERFRRGAGTAAQWLLVLLLTVDYSMWTVPALRAVKDVSPTIAACDWMRAHTPHDGRYYSTYGVAAIATQQFGPDQLELFDSGQLPVRAIPPSSWYMTEGLNLSGRGKVFSRPHGRLFELARQRFFEISVMPATDVADFTEGWHSFEWYDGLAWRWTRGKGTIRLLPMPGPTRLTLAMEVPAQRAGKAIITVRLNGVDLGHVVMEKEWKIVAFDVSPRSEGFNELELVPDAIFNPHKAGLGDDDRDLGLRLDSISWALSGPVH